MAPDSRAEFLAGVPPDTRPIAGAIVGAIPTDLTTAIKWRQLTYAVDADFDHWVCAVAAGKQAAALVLHFGSLLDIDVFDASDARYTRRITYRNLDDVESQLIQDLVRLAVDTLPKFRQMTRRS